MDAPDVIIVGSGPAGTAAARPLVAQGVKVLMIEAATDSLPGPSRDLPPLAELRRAPDPDHLLGPGLSALRSVRGISPKLRMTAGELATETRAAEAGDQFRDFRAVRIPVLGGLSTVWGAVVGVFDDHARRGRPRVPTRPAVDVHA